jgi:hypothetical protein
MPSSAVLVPVLLALLEILAVAVKDGCSGEIQLEFAPGWSLLEDRSVSLAGIRVPEPCAVLVAATALELRASVWPTVAPVTWLNNEKATVLRSRVDDRALEMYTVEKVAVIVPEVVGRTDVICVPFVLSAEGRGVSLLLGFVNNPEEITDEALLEDIVVTVAFVEENRSDVELEPAVSEVGIATLAEEVVEGNAIDVECWDEADRLRSEGELKIGELPLDADRSTELGRSETDAEEVWLLVIRDSEAVIKVGDSCSWVVVVVTVMVVARDSPEDACCVKGVVADGVAWEVEVCNASIEESGNNIVEEAELVLSVSEGSSDEGNSLAAVVLSV